MRIYLAERPAVLSTALAPLSVGRMAPIADAPSHPQTHQVPIQAELVQAAASATNKGINGFTDTGLPTSLKWMDVRGVPPRGRPV